MVDEDTKLHGCGSPMSYIRRDCKPRNTSIFESVSRNTYRKFHQTDILQRRTLCRWLQEGLRKFLNKLYSLCIINMFCLFDILSKCPLRTVTVVVTERDSESSPRLVEAGVHFVLPGRVAVGQVNNPPLEL